MEPAHVLAPLALGYLLGSIPFGLLLTRAAGLGDIRAIGSGNIGATNVLRTGRKELAAATLILDAVKGLAAVLICATFGPIGGHRRGLGRGARPHVSGVAPLQGRQGRGDHARRDVGLELAGRRHHLRGLAADRCGISLLVARRAAQHRDRRDCGLALSVDWRVALAITVLVPLVWVRHHENIARLLKGTESKIGQRSKA